MEKKAETKIRFATKRGQGKDRPSQENVITQASFLPRKEGRPVNRKVGGSGYRS
jgi:hypothetical protein